MPKVSVLLPAFNRAQYVSAAIQSALDQSLTDLEVVVVDDGSTDNTREVVRQFQDARVRLIPQRHRGISAAFNTAFRAARGDYIALLGSDDLWLPDLLAEEAPILDEQPTIGVVYARAQAMDVEGRPLARVTGAPPKYPGNMFKSLLYGDHLSGITALCRRELIERIGMWDENLIANEDWDLWLRLAQVCRFHFVDKILARFRIHPGRITSANAAGFERVLADRVHVLEKVYAQADLAPEILRFKPFAFANLYVDLGLRWINAAGWKRGGEYLMRAIRISPQPLTTLVRILYLIGFYQNLRRTLRI